MATFTVEFNQAMSDAVTKAAAERHIPVEELIACAAEVFLAEDSIPFDAFTAEDIAAIEEGMAQLRRGEGIPHDEVMARINAKHGW